MLKFLCAVLALAFCYPTVGIAKSLALIIGNDSYTNIAPLRKARSDAAGYSALFAGQGFDVTLREDLGGRDMVFELSTFFDRIQPGDTVVFVFSGHGWSDGTENFLVPTDIRTSGSETLLARESFALRNGVNGVIDEINKRGAGLTLAIIDACRNNPFTPKEGTRSVGLSKGLAPLQAPVGTFVAFSAGAGQTALDRLSNNDPAPYSVFTRHFLQELGKPQDLQSAFKQTQRLVNEEAGRVGHPQRPAYYDEVIGSACLSDNCTGAAQPALQTQPAITSAQQAAIDWEAFKTSNSIEALERFARQYSGTGYAALAQERIASLTPAKPAPQPIPQAAPTGPRPKWCRAAATPTELAICSNPQQWGYDQRINVAYKYWRERLTGSARTRFTRQQKSWIAQRGRCGGNQSCIAQAYQSRLAELGF